MTQQYRRYLAHGRGAGRAGSCAAAAPAPAVLCCAPRQKLALYTMSETKRFTRAEVAAYNTKTNSVFIIHNHVYDVHSFMDEHPGGHEVLVKLIGEDASEGFDDIGHSLDAKDLMKKYRVGELVDSEKTPEKKRPVYTSVVNKDDASGGLLGSWKLPLVLGLLATLVYNYLLG